MVGSGESGEEMESSLLLWSLRSRGGYRFKGFQKIYPGECYYRGSGGHGNPRKVKRCAEEVMSKVKTTGQVRNESISEVGTKKHID